MPTWSSLNESKEINFFSPAVVAVRPKNLPENTPLFCPVCSWAMSSMDDYMAFKEYQCCAWCELTFARRVVDKKNWLSGLERPSKEQLENFLKERQLLSFSMR